MTKATCNHTSFQEGCGPCDAEMADNRDQQRREDQYQYEEFRDTHDS